MTMPNGQHPPVPRPGGPAVSDGTELVQPVPMAVTIYTIDAGSSKAVVMRIATPLGPLHFVFSPDEAIQVGGTLRQQGKVSKIGLALPPGVNLGDGSDDETTDEVALPPIDLEAAKQHAQTQAADLLGEQRRASGGPEITET